MREDMKEVMRLINQYGFYKWEEGYVTSGKHNDMSDEDYNKKLYAYLMYLKEMYNKILNEIEKIIE